MNVASAGAIHGKRSVIERERGILACAHRHPIPLGGIRDGTNAGHACIDILKHERMSLKGDTFVGKLQDMVVVIDSEVIIKVKTSGFGIDKELNGRTVKDRKENRGEDSRNICEIMTTRIAGGLLLGYNPWKAGARLKTPAFTAFRPDCP